jgi:hypothetical protein
VRGRGCEHYADNGSNAEENISGGKKPDNYTLLQVYEKSQ